MWRDMLIAHVALGAHDSRMFKRSLSRGTSIVAALALVGMLSIALVFTQFLLPDVNRGSQSASAVSTAAGPAGFPNMTNTSGSTQSNSANPKCSTITNGKKVEAKSAADAKKQPCVCLVDNSSPEAYQSLSYTVSAKFVNGSADAITTVTKTGTPAPQNAQCKVNNSELGAGLLPEALTGASAQAQQNLITNSATCLAGGGTTCVPALLTTDTKQGLTDAFNAIKANNNVTLLDGTGSAQYSDTQLQSGADKLNNIATCGFASCPSSPEVDSNVFTNGAAPFDPTADLNCKNGNCISLQPGDITGGSSCTVGGQSVGCDNSSNPKELYVSADEKAAVEAKGWTCAADNSAGGSYDLSCSPKQSEAPLPQSDPRKPSTFPQAPQAPGAEQQKDTSGGGLGNIGQALQSFLGGLMKGLGGAGGAGAGAACPSDPTAYAAQQQQYQQQLQQYNYQMQQYQYQQQQMQYQAQVSGYVPITQPVAPVAPVACTPTSSSNTCAAAPAQPTTACPSGTTLRPVTSQGSNGATCTTGWQCAASNATTPTAQLSCQPQVADVGMSVSISYGCTNAVSSTGSGFFTNGATSGSTTTVITAPPTGVTKATFGITCINQNLSGQASCDVQVSRPSIVLVANPKVVATSTASTVGWVTSGMSSCVVSSPQQADFTAANAGNTSVNGMATTSPITQDTDILLHCVTLGGGTRDATTTIVTTGSSGSAQGGTISVSSSADGTSIARGAVNAIQWSSTNVPSGSKMSLWLYDVRLGVVTALIANELSASSTYAWTLPKATDTCDEATNFVCGTDLIPGRQYGIEADLYTGDPHNASYGAQAYTQDVFTITQ
jgi:hypothetical protein